MNPEIQTTLKELLQKECWSTVAGKGTGSIFTLGLGGRIPRKRPIENSHLLKEQRENDSEYGLMVYSSWKLERESEIICDSSSDNSNDGPMVHGLGRLKGKRIKEVAFESFKQGLFLLFDENYRLQIACDGKELYGDGSDEFIIYTPTKSMSVTTDKKIEIEPVTVDNSFR